MSDPSELCTLEVEEGIALLTLRNAPANCYSYELMLQLDACILEARQRDDVHALILTGEGERFFCAGADIAVLQRMTPTEKYYFCLHANETLMRLEQTPKLVVAALNGHTVGGGLEVALAADLRYARAGAGKVGLPEVKLGVLPGTGGTQRLVRQLGRAPALELMASGDLLTLDEAYALGLVQELIESEPDLFLSHVRERVARFIPPRGASRAVGLIKRAVHTGAELPFAEALSLERELQQQLFLSDDAREGMDANRDKRQPSFRGR